MSRDSENDALAVRSIHKGFSFDFTALYKPLCFFIPFVKVFMRRFACFRVRRMKLRFANCGVKEVAGFSEVEV
jgi:hypothetical protein